MNLLNIKYRSLGAISAGLLSLLISFPTFAQISPIMFKGVSKFFKSDMQSYSPTIGAAAQGLIYNLRFYGNFKRINDEKGGLTRQYINDEGLDDLSRLVKILFPSSGGALTTTSNHPENFGRNVTHSPRTMAILLNYAHDCHRKCPSLELTIDLIHTELKISSGPTLKKQHVRKVVTPLLKTIDAAVMAEFDPSYAYPQNSVELVLNAFFVQHFNTRKDLWEFILHLSDEIVDKHQLQAPQAEELFLADILSRENFEAYFDSLTGPFDIDEIFSIITADSWTSPTPYKPGECLISNGIAYFYDRLAQKQVYITFADCTETAYRHIHQMLHYDREKRVYDLSEIEKNVAKNGSPYFANYQKYFKNKLVTSANAGDVFTRSDWNEGMAGLPGVNYGCHENEANPTFINYLKTFYTIFGFNLDQHNPEVDLEEQKEWLENNINYLFNQINSTKQYHFDLSQVNKTQDGTDFEGNLIITVSQERTQLYSFHFSVEKNVHAKVGNLRYMQPQKNWNHLLDKCEAKHKNPTAQDAIWLLATDRSPLARASHPVHQLFSLYLADDRGRLEALKMFADQLDENSNWLARSPHLLNSVGHILEDLSWSDDEIVPLFLNIFQRFMVHPVMLPILKEKVLGFSFSEETWSDIPQMLPLLPNLENLWLAGLDPNSFDGIKELAQLKRLNMNNTGGLNNLSVRGLKQLEELNLAGSPIERIDGLEDLVALKKLDLSYTNLTSFPVLAGLRQLEVLNLKGMNIKFENFVPYIKELKQNNPKLTIVGIDVF